MVELYTMVCTAHTAIWRVQAVLIIYQSNCRSDGPGRLNSSSGWMADTKAAGGRRARLLVEWRCLGGFATLVGGLSQPGTSGEAQGKQMGGSSPWVAGRVQPPSTASAMLAGQVLMSGKVRPLAM